MSALRNMKRTSQAASLAVLALVLTSSVARQAHAFTSTHPASKAGTPVTYNNGPVLQSVKVVAVYWGNVNATVRVKMGAFYQAVVTSPFLGWLSEYNAGTGSFVGDFQITPAFTSTTVRDTDIHTELAAQINAGKLPVPDANTLYMIHFPPGFTEIVAGSTSCVDYCGIHNSATKVIKGKSTEFYYAVLPDMGDTRCQSTQCELPRVAGDAFAYETETASHELVEAITDPQVNPTQTGWTPEIGDNCQANSIGASGVGPLVSSNGVTYMVQAEWSNAQNACVFRPASWANTWQIAFGGKPGFTTFFEASTSTRKAADLKVGDFDGDGVSDVFTSWNGQWLVSYRAQTQWGQINVEGKPYTPTSSVLVGNLIGDKRSDVFVSRNGQWLVTDAGRGNWVQINTSGDPTSSLALGNFDASGFDDVFHPTTSGGMWQIAYAGRGNYVTVNTGVWDPISALLIGDFNGNQSGSDVFHITSRGRWEVAYSALGNWQQINTAVDSVSTMKTGDFDGDKKADIIATHGTEWDVVWSGTGNWQAVGVWPAAGAPNQNVTNALVGDFNGDGSSDLLFTL